MKLIFVYLLVLISPSVLAEPIQVPSLKACPEQHYTAQSVNGEAFQENLSLAEAALKALENYSSCSNETTIISTDSIVCHAYLGYLEVCAVPSDEGQFLIVKDHVDGASIHAFPKAGYKKLAFSSRESFAVPNADACYVEILLLDSDLPGSRDHRNIWIDLNRSYTDMRQASSLALRKLPEDLSLSCPLPIEKVQVSPESCTLLNGIQTCFMRAGESGYYITARGEARKLTVGFYRWD